MGRNGDFQEDGVTMLQLAVENATGESTTAEEMVSANESDEQCEEREQCELDEDDYAILELELPADDFVLISDTSVTLVGAAHS